MSHVWLFIWMITTIRIIIRPYPRARQFQIETNADRKMVIKVVVFTQKLLAYTPLLFYCSSVILVKGHVISLVSVI